MQNIPLFQTLHPEEFGWLAERMQYSLVPRRSVVYAPGDDAGELFFVLQGKIKTVVFSDHQQYFLKRLCFRGNLFGEHGLFGVPQRREAAFTLKEETRLAVFQVQDIRHLVQSNFAFTETLLKLTGEHIRHLERRVSAMAFMEARPRLIACLKDLVQKQGKREGAEWVIPFHLTHEELAAYTGSGRLSVTEMLTEMKRANLIHYDRERILIRDLDGLR